MCCKLIGSILVVAGGVILGCYIAINKKKRLYELIQLERIVAALEAEIKYHHALIYEACSNVSDRFGFPYCDWLDSISSKLIDKEGDRSFESIWEDAAVKLYNISHLKKEDLNELLEVGRALGYLDISTREKGLELEKERIHNLIETENMELAGRMKLSIVLCSLGGILLVILFI